MGKAEMRKDQLVRAAIEEIAMHGAGKVTVARIAKRAGVSSALAFHYFGDKDALLIGAMRHILSVYGTEVRSGLRASDSPRARLAAIVAGSFAPSNFRSETVATWLHFYVAARTDPAAMRLLRLYQRRLRSNLLFALRPLAGPRAEALAEGTAALIDGLYIRAGLMPDMQADAAIAVVNDYLARQIGD